MTTADPCCAGPVDPLLPETEATVLADIFRALADPTRVRLLRHLADSEGGTVCACHLPGALGLSQPTMSFHLHKLLDAGLVSREKRGRWVHWTVRPEAVATVRGFLELSAAERAEACC